MYYCWMWCLQYSFHCSMSTTESNMCLISFSFETLGEKHRLAERKTRLYRKYTLKSICCSPIRLFMGNG